MSKAAAFWDSSALVPLCLHEVTSRQALSQLRKSMPVVWWGSTVEVHSAISRLHRLGKLKHVEKQGALSRLALLSRGWRELLPGDLVRDLAMRLLATHEPTAPTGGGPDLVPTTPCLKNLYVRRSTPLEGRRSNRLTVFELSRCDQLFHRASVADRNDERNDGDEDR